MASLQDASIGIGVESTYKTGVTPTRWFEFLPGLTQNWNKSIKQGQGIRVAARVARSARRAITSAQGQVVLPMELTSKGMGLLWQAALGSGVSTLVSGSTQQQLFTIGDAPSPLTCQVGLPEVGGSVDAYTHLGCIVDSFEVDFTNDDIGQAKFTLNGGDLTTATGYAAPSYATAPNLFHFANGTISSGTLTAPTTVALASGTTTVADVRDGTLTVSNNLNVRLNQGGGGRQAQPKPGLRTISGTLNVEYDNTTFRDAVLNETPMCLILNYTGGALSTGVEQLQIVLPEVKFDSDIADPNGTDLIVQSMAFQVLDNLTAAQPIWIVVRTADAAL